MQFDRTASRLVVLVAMALSSCGSPPSPTSNNAVYQSGRGLSETELVDILTAVAFEQHVESNRRLVNQDGDSEGERLHFSELSGGPIKHSSESPLSNYKDGCFSGAWNAAIPYIRGYKFAIYLLYGGSWHPGPPSGFERHVFVNEEENRAAINYQELYFVCFAWPDAVGDSRKMLAVSHSGIVYTAPYRDGVPHPDMLMDVHEGRWRYKTDRWTEAKNILEALKSQRLEERILKLVGELSLSPK